MSLRQGLDGLSSVSSCGLLDFGMEKLPFGMAERVG